MFTETFSDGTHATTRLASAALRRVVASGFSVLDVGAGDGSLASVARRAGAGHVVAIDRRPWCRVPGVLQMDAAAYLPGARFDVVVANLPDETLLELAQLLCAAAGKALIVTGARLWRGRAVARALSELTLERPTTLDGWCCFVGWRSS